MQPCSSHLIFPHQNNSTDHIHLHAESDSIIMETPVKSNLLVFFHTHTLYPLVPLSLKLNPRIGHTVAKSIGLLRHSVRMRKG